MTKCDMGGVKNDQKKCVTLYMDELFKMFKLNDVLFCEIGISRIARKKIDSPHQKHTSPHPMGVAKCVFGVANPKNFFRATREIFFATPNQNCFLRHWLQPIKKKGGKI